MSQVLSIVLMGFLMAVGISTAQMFIWLFVKGLEWCKQWLPGYDWDALHNRFVHNGKGLWGRMLTFFRIRVPARTS